MFQNSGSLEEGLVLPEEPSAAQVIAENGNSSTEIIHDEHEEICESNESLLESSESLLNDDETGNGVIEENGEEEEDLKDGESEEDKEAVALKKRMWVAFKVSAMKLKCLTVFKVYIIDISYSISAS